MPDARVQSAIAHWAPRFVSNGVPLTDFEEVTAGVERWEDWCRAWSARAAVHDEQMKGAHRKAVACRNLALPLLDPAGERVMIPYEGKHLAGNLRKPAGAVKTPGGGVWLG